MNTSQLFAYKSLSLITWLMVLCCNQVFARMQQEETPLHISTEHQQPDTTTILQTINRGMQIANDNPDSSLLLYQSALQQSVLSNYHYGAARSLLQMATYYSDKGQYQQCFDVLQEAISYAGQSDRGQTLLTMIYSTIATLYQLQTDYEKAVFYYFRAILFAEKLPSSSGLDYAYSNLAGIFNIFGQPELALNYLKKAEQIAIEANHMNTLESALINRGIIYVTQEKWEQAMAHFQNSLYISKTYNLVRAHHFALINIAALHLKNDEAERALQYAREALATTKNINPYYINDATIILSQILIKLQRYSEAEDSLIRTLATAEKLNIGSQIARSHKALAQIFAATGRYHQAYQSHVQFVAIQDSIKSREIAHTINQLEMKFRLAEKDKELYRQQLLIYQQQRRIDRKNMMIIGTMTGAGILMILLVSLYRSRRHKQQIVQLKAMMKGEEKERNRIGRELHDGLGGMLTAINMTLGSIQKRHQDLPEMKELDTVTNMLQDMAAEIRKTSHNLMPDILLRHGFAETLRMYCDQINSGNGVQIHLQCYGKVNHLNSALAFSLYRILQELIQNIIKHSQAASAVIQLRQYGQKLTISVEDDGIGFDPDEQTEGAGLQNIRSRVQALDGHISIESTLNRGTTVYIEFDLEKLNIL